MDFFLTLFTKIKCSENFKVRPEIVELVGENIGITFFYVCLRGIFLDLSPQARETKAKINK